MKRTVTLLSSVFLALSITAQTRTVDDILAQKEQTRPAFTLKSGLIRTLVLPMTYGQDLILSEPDRKILREAQVISVDLVFSDFPKGAELKELNRSRIEQIKSLRKGLVTDPDIAWRIIRQTGCTDESEAKVLFHGAVIYYLPVQDERTAAVDIAAFDALPSTGDSLKRLVTRERPYGVRLQDSTILKVMERHKEWNDLVIVSDMTGSMSPYVTQLLVWFQLRMKDKRVKHVLFFNDGDAKAEDKKIIGKIGGLYAAKAMTYEEVLKAAEKTIRAGCGGDAPENNCEALLSAIDSVPQAKEYILVADNFAPVKDIVLAGKITKPVHVILCGSEYGAINPDYLELVRKTGGSLHTMKEDIDNLAKLNEGAKVKVGKYTYVITGGKFVLVTGV